MSDTSQVPTVDDIRSLLNKAIDAADNVKKLVDGNRITNEHNRAVVGIELSKLYMELSNTVRYIKNDAEFEAQGD